MEKNFVEKLSLLKINRKRNIAIGLYLDAVFNAALIYFMLASSPNNTFNVTLDEVMNSGILIFSFSLAAVVILTPAVLASILLYQHKKGLKNIGDFPFINFIPKKDTPQPKTELVEQLNNDFENNPIIYCDHKECNDKNCNPKAYLRFRFLMLKSYFIFAKMFSYEVFPVDKVLWAHLHIVTSGVNNTGKKYYYLKIYCQHEVSQYAFRYKKEVTKYLEVLEKKYQIFTEQNDELQTLHKENFDEFKLFCEKYKENAKRLVATK